MIYSPTHTCLHFVFSFLYDCAFRKHEEPSLVFLILLFAGCYLMWLLKLLYSGRTTMFWLLGYMYVISCNFLFNQDIRSLSFYHLCLNFNSIRYTLFLALSCQKKEKDWWVWWLISIKFFQLTWNEKNNTSVFVKHVVEQVLREETSIHIIWIWHYQNQKGGDC